MTTVTQIIYDYGPKFIYGYGHMVLKRRVVYGDMVPMVPRFGYASMVTKVSYGYGHTVTK